MLRDDERNYLYNEAIVKCVQDFVNTEGRRVRKAVDVGTGTGMLAIFLVATGLVDKVIATDTNKTILAKAKENARIVLGSDADKIVFEQIKVKGQGQSSGAKSYKDFHPPSANIDGADMIVSEILGTLIHTEHAVPILTTYMKKMRKHNSNKVYMVPQETTQYATIYAFDMPSSCRRALYNDVVQAVNEYAYIPTRDLGILLHAFPHTHLESKVVRRELYYARKPIVLKGEEAIEGLATTEEKRVPLLVLEFVAKLYEDVHLHNSVSHLRELARTDPGGAIARYTAWGFHLAPIGFLNDGIDLRGRKWAVKVDTASDESTNSNALTISYNRGLVLRFTPSDKRCKFVAYKAFDLADEEPARLAAYLRKVAKAGAQITHVAIFDDPTYGRLGKELQRLLGTSYGVENIDKMRELRAFREAHPNTLVYNATGRVLSTTPSVRQKSSIPSLQKMQSEPFRLKRSAEPIEDILARNLLEDPNGNIKNLQLSQGKGVFYAERLVQAAVTKIVLERPFPPVKAPTKYEIVAMQPNKESWASQPWGVQSAFKLLAGTKCPEKYRKLEIFPSIAYYPISYVRGEGSYPVVPSPYYGTLVYTTTDDQLYLDLAKLAARDKVVHGTFVDQLSIVARSHGSHAALRSMRGWMYDAPDPLDVEELD